jgi:peroxiredoxin (alkyl hydroperoxide reductase subunit C)
MDTPDETAPFSMPCIGDKAPTFTALTTHGVVRFPDQFLGSWIVFFSHPADFTPVGTSEIITFASLQERFAEVNCKLIGLSIDRVYSHIAWMDTIKEKLEYRGRKNVEVKFHLIEDITMSISRKFGMLHPNESATKAVRASFIIDPKGIVRLIQFYPLSVGRSMEELYRSLIALQTGDAFSVATPADWNPGENVFLPTPSSCEVAREHLEMKDDVVKRNWFFCEKTLSTDEIMKRLRFH